MAVSMISHFFGRDPRFRTGELNGTNIIASWPLVTVKIIEGPYSNFPGQTFRIGRKLRNQFLLA